MEQSKKWFYTAALYSDAIILVVFSTSLSLILTKLKFKVDTTGMITLSIFLGLAIIRMVNDLQQQKNGSSSISAALNIISQQLMWCCLYYFTFEMKLIQSVL
jgi:hypothetical protein